MYIRKENGVLRDGCSRLVCNASMALVVFLTWALDSFGSVEGRTASNGSWIAGAMISWIVLDTIVKSVNRLLDRRIPCRFTSS